MPASSSSSAAASTSTQGTSVLGSRIGPSLVAAYTAVQQGLVVAAGEFPQLRTAVTLALAFAWTAAVVNLQRISARRSPRVLRFRRIEQIAGAIALCGLVYGVLPFPVAALACSSADGELGCVEDETLRVVQILIVLLAMAAVAFCSAVDGRRDVTEELRLARTQVCGLLFDEPLELHTDDEASDFGADDGGESATTSESEDTASSSSSSEPAETATTELLLNGSAAWTLAIQARTLERFVAVSEMLRLTDAIAVDDIPSIPSTFEREDRPEIPAKALLMLNMLLCRTDVLNDFRVRVSHQQASSYGQGYNVAYFADNSVVRQAVGRDIPSIFRVLKVTESGSPPTWVWRRRDASELIFRRLTELMRLLDEGKDEGVMTAAEKLKADVEDNTFSDAVRGMTVAQAATIEPRPWLGIVTLADPWSLFPCVVIVTAVTIVPPIVLACIAFDVVTFSFK